MNEQVNRQILGWDIGGAHVKLALRDGKRIEVFQWPCPLWQGLDQLDRCFSEAKQQIKQRDVEHRVSMTGELVDLFSDRRSGVTAILSTFGKHFTQQEEHFVFGREGLRPMHEAWRQPEDYASYNWLVTATYVAGILDQGIVVDMGSTTTDVIAFKQGSPAVVGSNDYTRLKSLELVYTGVVRTGIGHVVGSLPFRQESVPIVAEYFSTMADVYRLTGELPAHADLYPSADRAGKTVFDSARRFARMIGLDYDEKYLPDWKEAAQYVSTAQQSKIKTAIATQIERCELKRPVLVGCGVGSFVVRKLAQSLDLQYAGFDQLLQQNSYQIHRLANDCAPAVSLVA